MGYRDIAVMVMIGIVVYSIYEFILRKLRRLLVLVAFAGIVVALLFSIGQLPGGTGFAIMSGLCFLGAAILEASSAVISSTLSRQNQPEE